VFLLEQKHDPLAPLTKLKEQQHDPLTLLAKLKEQQKPMTK
jgi:hypothetical protein